LYYNGDTSVAKFQNARTLSQYWSLDDWERINFHSYRVW
jgi:hypothetical protein